MVEAIVLMNYVGGAGESIHWYKTVKKRMLEISGVLEVYAVFGGYDLVARIRADDVDKLALLVADKLRSVPGIQSSHTLTVIF
jgi:DNA-binding Lrp family transcriptional regulator